MRRSAHFQRNQIVFCKAGTELAVRITVRSKETETEVERLVRMTLSLDGSRIIIRAPDEAELVVSSLKEAQVGLWSYYCDLKKLLPEEREAVKAEVFDEVAQRVMIGAFAKAWGKSLR